MKASRKSIKLAVAGAAVALFVLQALSSRSVHAYVSGPPASHTGAPGEGNCTECHTTFALNSGNGNVTITGLPNQVQAGATAQQTCEAAEKTKHNPNEREI